ELVFDEWTVRGSVDGQKIDYHNETSGYHEQVDTFLRAIETGDQSLILSTYRDGCGTLASTLAANRSLVSRKPELPEL
ncbi:MAG: hypothetical protein M3014_03535, partial [Chloroflexota bacterium]|nr:hypothetical protein [Chloroflexota bacterium]